MDGDDVPVGLELDVDGLHALREPDPPGAHRAPRRARASRSSAATGASAAATRSGGCRAAATRSSPPTSSSRIPSGSSASRSSFDAGRVHPRLPAARRARAALLRGGARTPEGRRLLLRRPSGFDLHSVREYEQGESLRRVHWPSTAKRGQLMVKELEDSPRDESAVLLDADAAAVVGEAPDSSFEVAVRAAGSILQAHASRGRRAALIVNSARPTYQRVHSFDGDWHRALELLAAVEPDGHVPGRQPPRRRGGRRCARARAHRRHVDPHAAARRAAAPAGGRAPRRRARLRRRSELQRACRQARPRTSMAQVLRLQRAGVPVAVLRQRRRPRGEARCRCIEGGALARSALLFGLAARARHGGLAPPRAGTRCVGRGADDARAGRGAGHRSTRSRGAGSSRSQRSSSTTVFAASAAFEIPVTEAQAARSAARLLRPGARSASARASSTSTTPSSRSTASTSSSCTRSSPRDLRLRRRSPGSSSWPAGRSRAALCSSSAASAGRRRSSRGSPAAASGRSRSPASSPSSSCSAAEDAAGPRPRPGRWPWARRSSPSPRPPRRRRGREARLPLLAELGSVRPPGRARSRRLRLELELRRHQVPGEGDDRPPGQGRGAAALALLARDDARRLHGPGWDEDLDARPSRQTTSRSTRRPEPAPAGGRAERGELDPPGRHRRGARDTHLIASAQPVRWRPGTDAPVQDGQRRRRRPAALAPAGPALHGLELRARGAKPSQLNRFEGDYPDALERYLEVVYQPVPEWAAPRAARAQMAVFFEPERRTTSRSARTRRSTRSPAGVTAKARTPVPGRRRARGLVPRGRRLHLRREPRRSRLAASPRSSTSPRHRRQGYCQHYAGAMAVMLRLLGIPARVAAGFTSGKYDKGEKEWVVTDHNAHTWVEVWFPRFGWLPFDPTPGRGQLAGDLLAVRAGLSLRRRGRGRGELPGRPQRVQPPARRAASAARRNRAVPAWRARRASPTQETAARSPPCGTRARACSPRRCSCWRARSPPSCS